MIWRHLVRPLLFSLPAETAHEFSLRAFGASGRVPGVLPMLRALHQVSAPELESERFGLRFANPLGLAAGVDKEARCHREFAALGFGFIEVGTLTALAQPGNEKPRLFRLPIDQAIINRMGFNNHGSASAAARLAARPRTAYVLGVNIGKSKVTPLENAVEDYLESFRRLFPHADYVTVNVSSPNTPGLRSLQDREPLERLLAALTAENESLAAQRQIAPKPILLKIAPDVTEPQLDDIAALAFTCRLAGLIATNTTISRDGLITSAEQVKAIGAGGLSGRPLQHRSREVVAGLYRRVQGKLPIIGVGGIFDADDAWQMLRAGASLLQAYTGFVYGGPGFARGINRGLLKRMRAEGISHLDQVIGLDVREGRIASA